METYTRDKKPTCHMCNRRFKSIGGGKWRGNCPHFRGRVIEWQ